MPRYSPAGSPLLSAAAALLEPAALDAQADLAEDLLRLAGTDYGEPHAARLVRAVALQVNTQVEQGTEWSVVQMSVAGSRTRMHRDWPVNPQAAQIVADVVAAAGGGGGRVGSGAWATTTSLRGRA